MTGIVQVHPDYSIQYEFIEPVKVILTPQEAEIVKQTARPAPLAPVDRTTRVVVILALVAGIAFSIFYDLKLKPEMYREKTLSELLAEIEKIREIKPEISQLQSPSTPLTTLPENQLPEKLLEKTRLEKVRALEKVVHQHPLALKVSSGTLEQARVLMLEVPRNLWLVQLCFLVLLPQDRVLKEEAVLEMLPALFNQVLLLVWAVVALLILTP